jgi:hypothetical protein
MTSLQRAAAYLKKVGPKAALAIVPLAMAVPSHAGVVLDVLQSDFESTGPGFLSPTISTLTTVPIAGSLVTGIYGSGSFSQQFSSGSTITLVAHSSGGASGVFPDSLTGAWDFSVSAVNDSDFGPYPVNWSVVFNIGGTSTSAASGSFTMGTTPTNFSGTASLNGTPGATITNWSSTIELKLLVTDAEERGHYIPIFDVQHLDIQSQDAAGVPEPSTFLLGAPVAGFLIIRARRRKR